MLSNALKDYISQDLDVVGQGENSFLIEVHKNYVTVDRKHQHTSLIESKTIKVDKDVIVYVNKTGDNSFDLQCKWLWRNPTVFKGLTWEEARELEEVINRMSNSLRQLAVADKNLPSIRVGKQLWAKVDIDLDMGLESQDSEADLKRNSADRLYTYTGAERVAANFPDWRIPTVDDFKELADFLDWGFYQELVSHLNFGFGGFCSNSIHKKELNKFMQMNPALQPNNGGFYWTSDLIGSEQDSRLYGKRKYIYLNRFTKKVSVEESINVNDNFFSLRLIHRKIFP